ncbi:MAG: TIGR02281 family clan AA aspartic protease [Thioalkalispiraceae bacterium]|jgi:aspartyl protease family protein
MNFKKIILSSLLSLIAAQSLAATKVALPEIEVVGLFKNAAVLNIDHQRKLVRVGDERHNVRLIAANSEKALVEVAGKRMLLSMADNIAVRVGLPAATNAQAHLISNGGMFTVTGSINQQLADFVVDTGASYITMSPQHARRLRLDYSNAKKIMMNTAKGKTTAHVFTVASVRIGGIELHNVKAAVVHELDSSKMLLGMSFLNQVEMQQKNGLMILRKSS